MPRIDCSVPAQWFNFVDELIKRRVEFGLTQDEAARKTGVSLESQIPSREGICNGENFEIGDDDWGIVADGFRDACESEDSKIPLWKCHPLLPWILARRPPFNWFDLGGTSE